MWERDGGFIRTGETYKAVVKFTFARGASLEDPSGLFNSSLDGNVRRAIDLHEGEMIDETALKALIRAAVALNISARSRSRWSFCEEAEERLNSIRERMRANYGRALTSRKIEWSSRVNADTSEYEDFYYASADGLRLHAQIYGRRTPDRLPVICLPGLTRNTRDFHELALYLSRDTVAPRQVISFNYRGRGKSAYDPNLKNYNVGVEANDILTGMQALGIHRALFIGTSRGGLILHVLAAIRLRCWPELRRTISDRRSSRRDCRTSKTIWPRRQDPGRWPKRSPFSAKRMAPPSRPSTEMIGNAW